MGQKQLKAIEDKKPIVIEPKIEDTVVLKLENNQSKTILQIENKKRNSVARTILQNIEGPPSDSDIITALALQQSIQTGPLKKLDYIAILIRLNPERNNALISQYNVQDIIDLIRYELYTKQLQNKN